MRVNAGQIAVFCLIVALLPFPSGCSITHGFPAVAIEEGPSTAGVVTNLLFASALFYVILRLSRKGLFNRPWRWGVYTVVMLHVLILLTLVALYAALLGVPGYIFEILYTTLLYTVYLPATLISSPIDGNYDLYVRASYVVMMGVFFAIGVLVCRFFDVRRVRRQEKEF